MCDSFVSCGFPFRICREPAFLNPFFLFKQFPDAPQQRKAQYRHQGGDPQFLDKNRADSADQAGYQEHRPTFFSKIVFRFDDDRMEHSDNEECAHTDQQSKPLLARFLLSSRLFLFLLARGTDTVEHHIMCVDLKAVFLPHLLVHVTHVIDVHIEQGATLLALEVVVVVDPGVVSFKIARQQHLLDRVIIGELPEIAIHRHFADRRMFLMHFHIHFVNCWMVPKFLHSFQNDLPLYRIPFHV